MLRTLGWLALLASPASAQFVAVTFNGDVLNVDQRTGIGALEFSTGVQGLQGMSFSPGGRLWCVSRVGTLSPRIWELDTVLGLAAGGNVTMINEATGMALAPSGEIYVVDVTGSVRSRLYVG